MATVHEVGPAPVDVAPAPADRGWRQWLETVVFPRAAPRSAPLGRTVVAYLVSFLGGIGYLLAVPEGAIKLTHVYAEDGSQFLSGAVEDGFPAVMGHSYAGYLHSVPRLIAELAATVPVGWAAVALAVGAAAVRSALALLVFAASGGHLSSRPLRLVVAAAVVLLPAGNLETIDNIANLHWFLLFAAFWALLWRPAAGWQYGLIAVVLLLAATSSPLVMLLVPLAVARLLLPAWRDRIVAITFAIGALVQAAVLFQSDRPRQPFDLVPGLAAAATRVAVVTFTGPELASASYAKAMAHAPHPYVWPAALATILALALALATFRYAPASTRFLTISCLLCAGGFMVLELFLIWTPALMLENSGYVLAYQRYSVAPCLFLFTAIAVGLGRTPGPGWRYPLLAVRSGLAVIVLFGAFYQWNAQATHPEPLGPTWSQGVTTATKECAAGDATATIAIQPLTWQVVLPCSYLRH